jgi:lipoprotein-releasing system permease protein
MYCRYIDDSSTGIYDIDSMSVYVDFAELQRLLDMNEFKPDEGDVIPARASQVQIKLTPESDPLEVRALITRRWDTFYRERLDKVRVPALLEDVRVLTWEERQQRFIAAVEKEKMLVTTLFGVISVVAIFLVGCIFYMIVQQNTRDIGIIKSVGATAEGVAGIFVSYGAAVGVVGGAIGSTLGTLFVWYINEVQDFLADLNPAWVIWDPSIYTFDKIPNEVKHSDLFVIYAVAIVASMFGSLMAAVRASRVWPVEALRYE